MLFRDEERVLVDALQGDMFQLPEYKGFFPASPKEVKVVTLLGGTLRSLTNEPAFVKNNLSILKKGDLLVVEVGSIYADPNHPEEIIKKDPRLSGALPKGWDKAYQRFLGGLLLRHYQGDIVQMDMYHTLDTKTCSVPGSYAVEMQAKILLKNKRTKVFTMMRWVRYQINLLADKFEELGLEPIDTWRFGARKDLYLMLFRKK